MIQTYCSRTARTLSSMKNRISKSNMSKSFVVESGLGRNKWETLDRIQMCIVRRNSSPLSVRTKWKNISPRNRRGSSWHDQNQPDYKARCDEIYSLFIDYRFVDLRFVYTLNRISGSINPKPLN